MFHSSGRQSEAERKDRANIAKNKMRFGIEFLDDALSGIFQDDLVLLGAPSGVGKTQLCCNIAIANLEDGKKVHYIALEASRFEIERRLKFPLVMERYYSDPLRVSVPNKITYTDWLEGKYNSILEQYDADADKFFEAAYRDLFVMYKPDKFGVSQLIESVLYCAEDTNLIIIDHVHYFDLDDDNENRGIKEIAKTVRKLALENQKPIILVAHLRKRDKQNEELVPGLDEFHGSSDLYKIATKVITFSPGRLTHDGTFETYFRAPKNRLDGGVTRFIGKEFFSPRKGGYESGKYQIGWAGRPRKEGFEEIDRSLLPSWARGAARSGSNSNPVPSRQPNLPSALRRKDPYANGD